jgi:hypothetical protein
MNHGAVGGNATCGTLGNTRLGNASLHPVRFRKNLDPNRGENDDQETKLQSSDAQRLYAR